MNDRPTPIRPEHAPNPHLRDADRFGDMSPPPVRQEIFDLQDTASDYPADPAGDSQPAWSAGAGYLLFVLASLLLVCSPAVVVATYRVLW